MMEIIFFAFLTGYLAFRLWSVLGKRTGFDRPPSEKPLQKQEGAAPDNVISLPIRGSQKREAPEEGSLDPSLEEGIRKIRAVDPQFNLEHFLRGAKAAFRVVVEAYAQADKAALKSLLSPSVYKSFVEAIQDRLEAQHTIETEIVDLKDPQLLSVDVKGKQEQITLKFSSEQITVTKDEAGKILDNPAHLSLMMKDIWTFSRSVEAKSPNWVLVATRIEGN